MFNKLRSNYQLSNVLVRIAFVLAYAFYRWQTILEFTQVGLQMYGMTGIDVSGPIGIISAVVATLLIGVIVMAILPLLVNAFLNFSRFYNVPRAEYGLLVNLFFAMYYFICGALSLVNLITPILLIWGEKLFPFIAGTGCMIWFYAVTRKLYFNDATEKYYFRNMAILYFVVAVVFGVVL